MKNKQNQDRENFITKRHATLILGFKNNRTVTELIKHGHLRTYTVDSSKRELLSKKEVLELPQKDIPPTSPQ
jgi:hypothetical protein